MINEYFNKVKSSKPFKRFDILIYTFVILLISILFLFFVILPNKENIKGFKVTVDNELVLTYIFGKEIDIPNEHKEMVEITTNDGYSYIKVFTDNNKTEYNVISINLENKEVKITEANCSSSHDCTLFPPLKNGGSIICLPHKLKLLSLEKGFSDPVVGG